MRNIPKIDYKEIFNAWKISLKPNKKQEELAELRLKICLGCSKRKEIFKGIEWTAVCEGCGCPLNRKVFSTTYNACPLKKWLEVDSKYITPIDDKNKKTLI